MSYLTKAARRYIALVNDAIPTRRWGEWGDILWDLGPAVHADPPQAIAAHPYALVEVQALGAAWITLHSTPEAAGDFHYDHGFDDSSDIKLCVDVRNGDVYEITQVVNARKTS